MAVGRTMRAPVSGRECLFWVLDFAGVPYEQRHRRVSEDAFFICDASGERVLVETARCVVDVPMTRVVLEGRPALEGIIAPGDVAWAWGIVTGTGDVTFVDGYRSATNVAFRIRSTTIDRAVIGRH